MPDNNNQQQKNDPKWQDSLKSMQNSGKSVSDSLKEVENLGDNLGKLGGTIGGMVGATAMKASANAGAYGWAKTVVGRAAQNIFEFPVFVSSSVPLDYATATNSLLEQIYASYLQMAISMNPVVDAKLATNGKLFSNLKTNTTKYLEYTDMFYAHDACENVIVTEYTEHEFRMVSVSNDDARVIQEALDYVPLSEFDHFFQEYSKDFRDDLKFRRDEEDRLKKRERDDEKDERERTKFERDEEDRESKRKREEADEKRKVEKHAIDKVKAKHDSEKSKRDTEKHVSDMKVKAPQLMDETKIQKLNTMKPLMMTVGVKVKSNDGQISDMVDYVVGVKTHCRVVPAEILPDVVQYPEKEMNRLANKAKWRAGELKFIDYFFNRKEKKQAAYDSKDPNRRWYHRLYTLAHSKGSSAVARRVSGTKAPDGLIPDCTMIITKADVDMIESATGIDLLKGSAAARFCKEMYMIGIVVLDTDAQSMKILLPDINNDYEVHSMASVNKQLATLDTAGDVSREVNKLMRGR